MFAATLALLAAAAPTASPAAGNTVSPLTVTSPLTKPPPADVTLNVQGSDEDIGQLGVVRPGTAYQVGLNGRVSLCCLVDAHGLAEHCDFVYEAPAGKGFGNAALRMRPMFKITPTLGPDGPIRALKTIATTFHAPECRVDGGEPDYHQGPTGRLGGPAAGAAKAPAICVDAAAAASEFVTRAEGRREEGVASLAAVVPLPSITRTEFSSET